MEVRTGSAGGQGEGRRSQRKRAMIQDLSDYQILHFLAVRELTLVIGEGLG